MNFATAFYLSSQVPAQFTGPALLLLLITSGAIALNLHTETKEKWFSALDYHKLILVVASIILLSIAQNIYLPYGTNPLTAIHLSVYVSLYIASGTNKCQPTQQWAIKITSIINFTLLIGSIIPLIQNIAFIEKTGGLRFQSYFSEPSVAAFIFVYNINQLFDKTKLDTQKQLLIILNLTCLLFTFSGSGFILLTLILLMHFKESIKTTTAIKYLSIFAALGVFAGSVLTDQLDQLVVSRVQAIMANQVDNSTFLRFIAPWLFIDDILKNGNFAWTGTGIGGLVPYIDQNQTRLWYLVDFEGQTVYNINNGYAAILAILGIPAGLTLILYFFLYLYKSRNNGTAKLLVAIYPFFSGYVIHPFIWLLLANVCQRNSRKNTNEH